MGERERETEGLESMSITIANRFDCWLLMNNLRIYYGHIINMLVHFVLNVAIFFQEFF